MVRWQKYLLLIIVAYVLAVVADSAVKIHKRKTQGDTGAIASFTYVNPKNGKARNFEISEFLEQGPNYVRFLTVDGRVIEINETELNEQ